MQNPEDRTPACYVMNFLKENCLKMRMGARPGQGRWGPCEEEGACMVRFNAS